MSQVIENTTDEAFALNQWLSDYPYDMTYEEIIDCLTNDEYLDSDNIVVWELIEEYSGRRIAWHSNAQPMGANNG